MVSEENPRMIKEVKLILKKQYSNRNTTNVKDVLKFCSISKDNKIGA